MKKGNKKMKNKEDREKLTNGERKKYEEENKREKKGRKQNNGLRKK